MSQAGEERPNAYQLSKLACPYMEQCELGSSCPFGHRQASSEGGNVNDDLRPIPWYFCMDHLLYPCQSATQQCSHLVRCQFGFHPTNEDLADAELFNARMASALLSGVSFPRVQQSTIFSNCAICNKRIQGRCVLLENCPHRFCIQCSDRELHLSNVLNTRDILCGDCGTTSKRIMYWATPTVSNFHRKVIFSLQRQAFGLKIRFSSQIMVSDQLTEGGQVVIHYRQTRTGMPKKYILESQQEPQESPTSPESPTSTSDHCAICLKHIEASAERLWAYLENCSHRFCLRCLLQWRKRQAPVCSSTGLQSTDFSCPTCQTKAARIFIWPASLERANIRQLLFHVQKLCFGLKVSSQLSISAHEATPDTEDLVFICNRTVWVPAYTIGSRPNSNN